MTEEQKKIFIYTKNDMLQDFNLKPGTFYNRIDVLGIKDNQEYMIKVKENNRDKTYYSQLAYDKLREYQESINNISNVSSDTNNNCQSADISDNVYIKQLIESYQEQISFLKAQVTTKDEQIQTFQKIIALQEQNKYQDNQILLDTKKNNEIKRRGFFYTVSHFLKNNKNYKEEV